MKTFFPYLILGFVFQMGCQLQFGAGYYLDTDVIDETETIHAQPSDTSTQTVSDPPDDSSLDQGSDHQTDMASEKESDFSTDTPSETGSDLPQDTETETESSSGTECETHLALCNTVSDTDLSYDVCLDGFCISPGTCGDSVSCNAIGVYYSIPPDDVPTSQFSPSAGDEPVVVDNTTRLIWQGCLAGLHGSLCDTKNDDVPEVLPAKKLSWEEALEYCDALVWRDLDSWHLPSEYELLTIVDYELNNPSIDLMAFKGALTLPLWTSAVRARNPQERWLVDFAYGSLASIISNQTAFVRCVIRGPAHVEAGLKRIESVNGEPIVEDAATGLFWQGCPAGKRGANCTEGSLEVFDWQAAVDYCKDLVWGNSDDWYLPGVKSLQSIADNRFTSFAMNETFFPRVGQEDTYWTSATVSKQPTAAWYVDFADYDIRNSLNTLLRRVRCVRHDFQ